MAASFLLTRVKSERLSHREYRSAAKAAALRGISLAIRQSGSKVSLIPHFRDSPGGWVLCIRGSDDSTRATDD